MTPCVQAEIISLTAELEALKRELSESQALHEKLHKYSAYLRSVWADGKEFSDNGARGGAVLRGWGDNGVTTGAARSGRCRAVPDAARRAQGPAQTGTCRPPPPPPPRGVHQLRARGRGGGCV